MRPHKAVIAAAVMLTVCATRAADTDLRAFVGTWKENQAKSYHFISGALTYKFHAESDGFVSVVRGNTPVRYRARIDGHDYPTQGSGTASWTKVTETLYESTLKRDGVVIASARWILSDGGTRLTQQTVPVRANGDNDINIIEYVRTSGAGNTLLGEWKPVSTRSAIPDLFVITLVDDELRVFYPKYGFVVYTIRLDGRRYPLTAPNASPGSGGAAEGIDSRTVRRVTFQGERATLEAVMSVAADGETMTVTTRNPGGSDEPSVVVYEKQR